VDIKGQYKDPNTDTTNYNSFVEYIDLFIHVMTKFQPSLKTQS
jgi:hypothetical protein